MKLEPCPFCGATAIRCGLKANVYVECSMHCEASFDSLVPAEKWNTRPLESALRSRIAALEARAVELESDLSAVREALLGKDSTDGCDAPGDWCGYKSWSELATDYSEEIKQRIALEKRNLEMVDAIWAAMNGDRNDFDDVLTTSELSAARSRSAAELSASRAPAKAKEQENG